MNVFLSHAEWMGEAAAFCTTVSFLPQLIRVCRRRTAADISLSMFLLFNAGLVFWLFYGLSIHSLPIILANTLTLVQAVPILVLKLLFDRRDRRCQ